MKPTRFDNLFYPFAVSSDLQKELQTDPVYPLVLDFHMKYGYQVNRVLRSASSNMVVSMGTLNGFNVLRLSTGTSDEGKSEFYLRIYRRAYCNDVYDTRTSVNPRYLLKSYDKFVDEQPVESTEEIMGCAIYKLISRIGENNRASRRDFQWHDTLSRDLTNDDVLKMMQFLTNKRTEIPLDLNTKIATKYAVYEAHMERKAMLDKSLTELITGPKYLIANPNVGDGTGARSGIIFGVMQVTHTGPIKTVQHEPMRWYPTFDHLPEQYRDEVAAKLTYAKLVRQSTSHILQAHNGYLPQPAECQWWYDLNMATWDGTHSHYFQWLLFPKN